MKDHRANVKNEIDARLEHISVPVGEGHIRWHMINRGDVAEGLSTVHEADGGSDGLAAKPRLFTVATLDDGTIVESHALWNNAIGREFPKGTGLGMDFDLKIVRDTFKGRLYGIFNSIKQRLHWR